MINKLFPHATNRQVRQHAIIIGGSISGLLAGAALSRTFDKITIIDKDVINSKLRPGVPHAMQGHIILQRGLEIINQYLGKEFEREFLKISTRVDLGNDIKWTQYHKDRKRQPYHIYGNWCERIVLENLIRKHVRSIPNIQIQQKTQVTGLLMNESRRQVIGVTLFSDAGERNTELCADVVIDASGRGTRIEKWLSRNGYPPVPRMVIHPDIRYSSCIYRIKASGSPDWKALLIYPSPPIIQRGGIAYQIDSERWFVGLQGWCGETPPGDESGFMEYTKSLSSDELHRFIRKAEQTSEIYSYRFKSSLWRRYDKMRTWPENLFAIGDSVSALNPIYGQGITIAALDVQALAHWFRQQKSPDVTAAEFQKKIINYRHLAWSLSLNNDSRFPQIGAQAHGTLLNWFFGRLVNKSYQDSYLHKLFLELISFKRGYEALFNPKAIYRILAR